MTTPEKSPIFTNMLLTSEALDPIRASVLNGRDFHVSVVVEGKRQTLFSDAVFAWNLIAPPPTGFHPKDGHQEFGSLILDFSPSHDTLVALWSIESKEVSIELVYSADPGGQPVMCILYEGKIAMGLPSKGRQTSLSQLSMAAIVELTARSPRVWLASLDKKPVPEGCPPEQDVDPEDPDATAV